MLGTLSLCIPTFVTLMFCFIQGLLLMWEAGNSMNHKERCEMSSSYSVLRHPVVEKKKAKESDTIKINSVQTYYVL